MRETKPYRVEMMARGQLTIPKKICQNQHLKTGQIVSLVPLGDLVIVMPQRLELDRARRRMAKILRMSGVSAEDMLADLGQEREALYKERYRKKVR